MQQRLGAGISPSLLCQSKDIPAQPISRGRADGRSQRWRAFVSLVRPGADGAIAGAAKWGPLLVTLAGLILFAAFRLLHLASADALLPVLMSTDRLTWFYWGQDRLANLVPLLAAAFQQPRLNFAVQMAIVASGWYGLMAICAAHHLRVRGLEPAPATLAAGTLASGLAAAALLPEYTEYVFVFEQLYAPAALLVVIGVLLLTHRGRTQQLGGFALVLAATMVNPAITLCVPLILVLSRGSTPRGGARTLAAGVVALASTAVASAVFGTGHDSGAYSDFALDRAFDNFGSAIEGIAAAADWKGTRLPLGCALGVLLACCRARGGLRVVWSAALIAGFAGAWTALFSGNLWVEHNGLGYRYFFPVFAAGLFVLTSAMTECAAQLRALARRARRTSSVDTASARWPVVQRAVACVALAAIPGTMWILSRVGVDSLIAAEARVDRLAAADIHFVAGNYWSVWPTVVEARTRGLTAWGLTLRAEVTRSEARAALTDEIQRIGSARVMCLDVDAQQCLDATRLWTDMPVNLVSAVSTTPLVISVR